MAPRVRPTPVQLAEIERRVDAGETYVSIARWLGCNVDTLRRIMHRHEIVLFDGAKYQPPRDFDLQMWERPCIRCRSTERRPKNHYLCDACKARADGRGDTGLPDEWLVL